ncbi:hypothetical protein LTR37_020337 [Vermiconidia calcicola]|uniref:Uncharacterized protein n=1 Tax=Vermiconidia calcicola TaxID=1690605 RepID=A0ACC3MBI5_9PEZI|nr:hypothetical protein LTR37_020337 [Vermiconidia calcicola]
MGSYQLRQLPEPESEPATEPETFGDHRATPNYEDVVDVAVYDIVYTQFVLAPPPCDRVVAALDKHSLVIVIVSTHSVVMAHLYPSRWFETSLDDIGHIVKKNRPWFAWHTSTYVLHHRATKHQYVASAERHLCKIGLPRPKKRSFHRRTKHARSNNTLVTVTLGGQVTQPPRVYFDSRDITQKTWTARLWVTYREGSQFLLVLRHHTEESIIFHHTVLASQTDPPTNEWVELREQNGSCATWMRYNGGIWEYRNDVVVKYQLRC